MVPVISVWLPGLDGSPTILVLVNEEFVIDTMP